MLSKQFKTSPSRTKVLFIGMDAGDKFLLRRWASDGTLPNLSDFFAEGLVGDVAGLEGFYEGSTWPSFYTGVTPANHGVHSLNQLKPGTYEVHPVPVGEFIKHEAFWEHLRKAGCRIALLDIPLTGICTDLNGIQMVEWGTHDSIYGFRTWPKQLRQEVLKRFGPYPLLRPCDSFSLEQREFQHFKKLILESVHRKSNLTTYFLSQEDWDFFAQVFTEGHCMGHQYWHMHDQNHPHYQAMGDDPVRDTYIAIDAAFGEILSHVDRETTVIFLASHRMAHYFGMQFLLPEILIRLGCARPLHQSISVNERTRPFHVIHEYILRAWRKTPYAVKDKLWPFRCFLKNLIGRREGSLMEEVYGLDQRKSACFLLANGDSVCGLRINLIGREPQGLIQPGAEMESLCDELALNFAEIVDLDSGKPIVKSVRRTSDLYHGRCLDCLPDLLIEWHDDKPLGGRPDGSVVRVGSSRIGTIEGVYRGRRTGDHRPDGMFAARGPHIKPGRIGRSVSIMDFAPTFSSLLGVNLPNVDGRVIEEILKQ